MQGNAIRLRTVVAMALLATAASSVGYLLGRSDAQQDRVGESSIAALGVVEGSLRNGAQVDQSRAERTPAVEAGADEDLEDADSQARLDRIVRGMWWNRPELAQALALEEGQKARMAEQCRTHLLRRWKLRREEKQVGDRAEADALLALDINAARVASAARSERLGWLATADRRLAVEVLSELEPEQLAELARLRPVLLRQPWLKTVGRGEGGGMASGVASGAAAAAAPPD